MAGGSIPRRETDPLGSRRICNNPLDPSCAREERIIGWPRDLQASQSRQTQAQASPLCKWRVSESVPASARMATVLLRRLSDSGLACGANRACGARTPPRHRGRMKRPTSSHRRGFVRFPLNEKFPADSPNTGKRDHPPTVSGRTESQACHNCEWQTVAWWERLETYREHPGWPLTPEESATQEVEEFLR